MSNHVDALAPFVERALDARGVVEALGTGERSRAPRSSGTEWGAAASAASRLEQD